MNINIAGTFTIENLEPGMHLLLTTARLEAALSFAPYNQVLQQLIDPASLLSSAKTGVNIVIVRLEDFVRNEPDERLARDLVDRTRSELEAAATAFGKRSPVPTIYLVFHPTAAAKESLTPFLAEHTDLLASHLDGVRAATVLRASAVLGHFGSSPLNPVGDELAHIPYTEEYFCAMALTLVRAIHRVLVSPQKVLVLDCDNTIWDGVVGEDGVAGIKISEPFAAVQRFAVKVQSEGGLVCLASKNSQSDVLDVFTERRDMELRLDQIVDYRINWEPKYLNVQQMAASLNLGLDSFVFIDDNVVECEQMRQALPEVVTICLPPAHKIESFLRNLWLFDRAAVTKEDARRTEMYKQSAARQELERSAGDIGEFIRKLNVEIDIRPPSEDEWARVAQLTQKTNQFNFTTIRLTEAELRTTVGPTVDVLRVGVRDRFGDYGLVGLLITVAREDALHVHTCILSCRVLGRGVEHAMVRRLGAEATRRELGTIVFKVIPTPKNTPALAFINSVASRFRQDGADASCSFLVPAAWALEVVHSPGMDPEEVVQASRPEPQGPIATSSAQPNGVRREQVYERLAAEFQSGTDVLVAIQSERRRRRTLSESPKLPSGATQSRLVDIWKDVLSLDCVGVDDPFSALGGTSLLAVKLFAEVASNFGQVYPVSSIVECPTIRQLATLIDGSGGVARTTLVPFKRTGRSALFLVHEGNGEVLLYNHLSDRLPDELSVFGVQPVALPNVPIAFQSVEAMAAHYVKAILEGPTFERIYLGGLCAGGTIAYEMACQLVGAHRSVAGVFIIDAATPQLKHDFVPKEGELRRGSRIAAEISSAATAVSAIRLLVRRTANWMARRRSAQHAQASQRRRLASWRAVVEQKARWPDDSPPLSAMDIYDHLEAAYRPGRLSGVPVTLIHATSGEGADRPLRSLYADRSLGWSAVVADLSVEQAAGGHASMFQPHHVESLGSIILKRMRLSGLPNAVELQDG